MPGWNWDRARYTCTDGTDVAMRRMDRPFTSRDSDNPRPRRQYGCSDRSVLRHGIADSRERYGSPVTVAANAIFSRDMERAHNIADDTRTLVLEDTALAWRDPFVKAKRLRTVVFDEGPSVPGEMGLRRQIIGLFQSSGVRHVQLPTTLEGLSRGAFRDHRATAITLPEGLTSSERTASTAADSANRDPEERHQDRKFGLSPLQSLQASPSRREAVCNAFDTPPSVARVSRSSGPGLAG